MLAQQTIQEQTDLEHKRGLMEPALPGKFSITHLLKPQEHLHNTKIYNEMGGGGGSKSSSRNMSRKGGKNAHKKLHES